jgi:hypothetical protein
MLLKWIFAELFSSMSQDKYAGKLKTLSITNETSLYPFPGASYDFPRPFSDLKKNNKYREITGYGMPYIKTNLFYCEKKRKMNYLSTYI